MDTIQKLIKNYCEETCILELDEKCNKNNCEMRNFVRWYYERGWVYYKNIKEG